MIFDHCIESNNLIAATWLSRHELGGAILSWQITDSQETFASFVKTGEKYDVQVTLHPPPPECSSLWLCYLSR
jgi:hypothetical protein